MQVLVHGRLWLGTHRTLGRLPRLLGDGGNRLCSCMTMAGAGWVTGWRYLGMIHRVEHNITRPDDYDYLLALCRNEIPKAEAQDLLVN